VAELRRFVFALALAAAACTTPLPTPPPILSPLPRLADCPGRLRPTQEIEGDWVIHEQVRVTGGAVDESYGLVVQKTGPKLVLLGLTPFGAKAFSVVQIGTQTWSESYLGPATVVPPENVLRDLHRALFLTVDDAALEPRAVSRDAEGAVHVTAKECGYEAVLAPVSATPIK
jgi:Protein of unknown function (DUF3261)